MWIFMSSAFFSVVADETNMSNLLVRARFAGDIGRVFPGARVSITPKSDYRYRTSLPRAQIAAVIAGRLAEVDYPNFKDSVADPLRHEIYGDVWTTMYRAQAELAPRGSRRARKSRRRAA